MLKWAYNPDFRASDLSASANQFEANTEYAGSFFIFSFYIYTDKVGFGWILDLILLLKEAKTVFLVSSHQTKNSFLQMTWGRH